MVNLPHQKIICVSRHKCEKSCTWLHYEIRIRTVQSFNRSKSLHVKVTFYVSESYYPKMATKRDWGLDIVNLASAITARNMESIAIKYMDIDLEKIENLKREHRQDIQAFNRSIISTWAFKSREPDQVEVPCLISSHVV